MSSGVQVWSQYRHSRRQPHTVLRLIFRFQPQEEHRRANTHPASKTSTNGLFILRVFRGVFVGEESSNDGACTRSVEK